MIKILSFNLQRICMNNCQYTQTQVLPRINKSFQEVGQLSLEKPIAEAIKCYVTLDGRLFEAYMEQKIEPIVAIIEPSMYVGKFDWAKCPKPLDARDYVKEIIHNVISVHAEVDRVSPRNSTLVNQAMIRIVEAVTEEVNRLFCCISRMNSNGCIQVTETETFYVPNTFQLVISGLGWYQLLEDCIETFLEQTLQGLFGWSCQTTARFGKTRRQSSGQILWEWIPDANEVSFICFKCTCCLKNWWMYSWNLTAFCFVMIRI